LGNASSNLGQDPDGVGSGSGSQNRGSAARALNTLIDKIFAPVTEKLNLTQEQQFQIISIIIETEVTVDPLLQSLAKIDQQLSELPLSEVLDENLMKEICERQASIISEVVQMRLRAKARMYRLLTTEQRAIMVQQFRTRRRLNDTPDPISINEPLLNGALF
jgi:hypothetical protein